MQGMFSAGSVSRSFLTRPARESKCRVITIEQLLIGQFQRISHRYAQFIIQATNRSVQKYQNVTQTMNERFTRTPSAGDTK